jgi:cytochrome c oxidase subunit II
MRISMLTVTVLVAAMAWPVLRSVTRAQEQGPQTIEMTAKKYNFDPSLLRMKEGTKLILKITATDRTHGFGISTVAEGAPKGEPGLVLSSPPEKDCYRLAKGQQVTVEIEAKAPGTYKFKCCIRCGMGHGRMKGELIVDPS